MRKRLLLLVTLVAAFVQLHAQTETVTMKKRASVDDMREMLNDIKDIFDGGTSLSLTITTADPVRTFEEMPSFEAYDEKYLQKQRALLHSDTSNSVAENNIATYYTFVEKNDSALIYYNRSLSHLSLKYFPKDSAAFLSFRGTLKMNLGMENAIDDIERALKINPNDSLASMMYPFFFVANRDFEKLAAIGAKQLDGAAKYPYIPYVYLVSGRIMADFFPKSDQASDDKIRAKYAATDYDKLFNMAVIDKYAEKYKTSIEMRNVRYMADIFALTLKLLFFTDMDKPKPVFAYTLRDKQRLQFLEKKFTSPEMEKEINAYSRNKMLGFIYFMLQQKEKSIAHFNEAIKVFPIAKRNSFFDPGEAYDAINAIYGLEKSDNDLRELLLAKIKAEPLGKKNSTDYSALAQHYFRANDNAKAREWALKAREINPDNADAIRLLTHLSYLDQDQDLQPYMETAAMVIQNANADQQYSFLLQIAIYYVLNGSAPQAYNNIKMAKQLVGEKSCELCDKLINKFLTVTK
ncbi:MAG TPA: hypothetical protein VHM26_07535 [Chitinophagaceae bacterium]|jgi:tetratricopeptide (TPR) repeat protein|nr:hypothetical protein [Chitinophagaceae bacterium]